jgi:hypothetical protein
MLQALSAALRILFWFLKRKKAKSHEDFHTDIKDFNKALADGDDDALTIAFDKLRLEGSSGSPRWETSGMPRRQDKTLSGG